MPATWMAHLARSAVHVGEPVSQSGQSVGGRCVVAPHVAKSADTVVAQSPVEFDQQAVLLVEHIDLGAATGRLPVADGEAVRPLDEVGGSPAPAGCELRPRHRRQASRAGDDVSESVGTMQPRIRFVVVRRVCTAVVSQWTTICGSALEVVDQIEHSVLDGGSWRVAVARRLPGAGPFAAEVSRAVDPRRRAGRRHQDLDGPRLGLCQTPLVSRRQSAEPSAVAADEQAGPGERQP